MRAYKTESGSIYYVDGNRILRAHRSQRSNSERLGDDWREAESVTCDGVGHRIMIVWGVGRDEHSDAPGTIVLGDDSDGGIRLRTTFTSPVVEILEQQ